MDHKKSRVEGARGSGLWLLIFPTYSPHPLAWVAPQLKHKAHFLSTCSYSMNPTEPLLCTQYYQRNSSEGDRNHTFYPGDPVNHQGVQGVLGTRTHRTRVF